MTREQKAQNAACLYQAAEHRSFDCVRLDVDLLSNRH
jgi:hypothetical protein